MPSFDFDSGESKLLTNMFDQTLKQFGASKSKMNKQGIEILENITYKVKTYKGKKVNFSQQEHQVLKQSITEAIGQIQKQITEVWFGKRFLMKMVLKQYRNLNNKLNNIPKASKKKK